MATSSSLGPAHAFWVRAVNALPKADITQRDFLTRAGVSATTFAGLKIRPARDLRGRWDVVQRLAAALNEAVAARDPEAELPFPDPDETLRLAGLAPAVPDPTISVRDIITATAEYDPHQKAALLSLLDYFDRDRGAERDADRAG